MNQKRTGKKTVNTQGKAVSGGAFAAETAAEARIVLPSNVPTVDEIDVVEKWTGSYEADCVEDYYPAVQKLVNYAREATNVGPSKSASLPELRAARDQLNRRIHATELNRLAEAILKDNRDAAYLASTTHMEEYGPEASYMVLDHNQEKVEVDEASLESLIDDTSFSLAPNKYERPKSPLRGCHVPMPLRSSDTFVFDLHLMADTTAETLENLPKEWK